MVYHWVSHTDSLVVLVIVSGKAMKDQGPDVASRHAERREKAEEARFASSLDTHTHKMGASPFRDPVGSPFSASSA